MKKTLLVTLDFYPSVGGIATYWRQLGKCMPPEKWIVLAPPLPTEVSELDSMHKIYRKNFFSRFFYPRWFLIFFQTCWVVKKEKIKAIIVGQVLPVGTAVWLASKMLHIPYSVSVHGMDIGFARRHWRKKKLCKKILANASCVIVNSAYTASRVREYGISEQKIQCVYPCPSVTPAVFKKTVAIPQEFHAKKIVLSVGRLVARKGFNYLIRAFPEVIRKEPDAVCVILGDGPMASELEGLVKNLELNSHIFFIKHASDSELAAWYDACTMCVMASYEEDGDAEGFGIVYLDANSFGKPVIGARSGGIPEAISDGETGLLVEPKNSAEIARAILHLLFDPSFARKLGVRGCERALRYFQWHVQAEKLKKRLE